MAPVCPFGTQLLSFCKRDKEAGTTFCHEDISTLWLAESLHTAEVMLSSFALGPHSGFSSHILQSINGAMIAQSGSFISWLRMGLLSAFFPIKQLRTLGRDCNQEPKSRGCTEWLLGLCRNHGHAQILIGCLFYCFLHHLSSSITQFYFGYP